MVALARGCREMRHIDKLVFEYEAVLCSQEYK
jgi:hypothetical protein